MDERIDWAVADAGVAFRTLRDEGEFFAGAGGAVDQRDVWRRGRWFEIIVGEVSEVADRAGGVCGGFSDRFESAAEEAAPEEIAARDLFIVWHRVSALVNLRIVHDE